MADMRRRSPEPPPGAPQIQLKPGLAMETLRELAPLLAEEGIDVDNIDVPDLAQEVNQKEAVVQQRLMDAKLARALVKNAQAAVEFSRNAIKQREAFVKRSQSIVDFRRKRYQRYVELSKRDGVEQEIVAEEDKAYRAAVAEHKSAKLAVKKAEADLREQLALLDRAKANVEVQEAMVGVARKDRDRALALADYAKIYAPFDGVVTDKTMDPGNFVQNATSAHTKPILSLDRIDLVTVVMKLPDNDAPYVKTDTEAIIQMDDLPGTEIRGKVTRFAPAIKNADRNMRVEVDLFNGTEQQYRRYVLQTLGGFLAPLGTTETLDATVLMAASRNTWKLSSKSNLNAFPLMPQVEGRNLGERPLLPGMTGYMRLLLRKFKNLYLVPSSAVYNRGGKSYILVVRDGAAHQLPVRVQANDGAVAKIAVIDHEANPKTGERELDKDLTGREEIIVSRQAELGEGQGVRTTLEKW
jgi:multidrug resistance efflux pump